MSKTSVFKNTEDKAVLIIDDSEVIRTALRRALENTFWVISASTGSQGIKRLTDSVGLVLLDLVLPDMRGIDVLRRIKHSYPSLPVVIITGHGSEDACIEAFRRGARDYIKKPFKSDELIRKVEVLMYVHSLKLNSRKALPISVSDSPEVVEQPKHIRSWVLQGIMTVKNFIDNNPTMSIDLNYAAKMAGMNRSYLCRYFKEVTGFTFKDYLTEAKFNIAKDILKERDASVRDAADASGYRPKYFSEAFKRECGFTPKVIKK